MTSLEERPDVSPLVQEDVPGPPGLPLGRRVELPGRGTTFVREVQGPPGAPTVVLLHGWIASGGLNWFQVMEPLAEHFHVLAPDLRGHGRGIRSSKRFTLADCADDVDALCEQLGIDEVIAVGYSLGGPVAQLLWRQHPERVRGLVLAATAQAIVPIFYQRMLYSTMMMMAAGTTRLSQIVTKLPRRWAKAILPIPSDTRRPDTLREWTLAEVRRHNVRMVLEAGMASGHFKSTKWIGDCDVPTVVLITTQDKAISPMLQARMAFSIPDAVIHRVDEGHLLCMSPSFADPVIRACLEVTGSGGSGTELPT